MAVDPALAALLTPEGRVLVEEFTPYDQATALQRLAAVRRDPVWRDRPDVVAAAASQARLRTRAALRFPGAPRWWTADGLEQATRPEVSRLHAERFVAAGVQVVADLGCGAGSDALALLERGLAVQAVDLDPAALWALRASAADRGVPIRTELGDVTSSDWWWNSASAPGSRGCFVDPSRRREGRRLLDPRQWSPRWSWVTELTSRVPATGAKVAPGIAHSDLPSSSQAEWVSVDGDLVECGVWCGPLRSGSATRVATVASSPPRGDGKEGTHLPELVPGSRAWAHLDDRAGVPEPSVGSIGGWLVEPDPAVIRAGLVSVLADRIGGHLLDPRIAYVLTDAEPMPGPFGEAFEILEEVPFGRKHLRAHLRRAGYGDVVVKKRGVAIVPEQLRADLQLRGDGPTATVILTRTDAGPMALLVRRTAPDKPRGS